MTKGYTNNQIDRAIKFDMNFSFPIFTTLSPQFAARLHDCKAFYDEVPLFRLLSTLQAFTF